MSKKKAFSTALLGTIFLGASLIGCAAPNKKLNSLEERLSEKSKQVSSLESQLKQQEKLAEKARKEAERAEKDAQQARKMAEEARESGSSSMSTSRSSASVNPDDYMLPPKASAGECYARVLVPPVYETATEQVLKKDAYEKLAVVPAEYEWGEEQVLVKEASERIEVVPAEYETITEKVLVSPARTYWKKGSGPVERVDNATGEIMCLVEEPAVYKNVTKRVLKNPETTRKISIPAEYKTVKVKKQVRSATTKKTTVPAQYQMVTKSEMVKPSYMEWRPILCETNANRNVVMSIQRALKEKGHDPGPIDGILGSQTRSALRSFQTAQKLPSGALTFSTIQALGVEVSSRR